MMNKLVTLKADGSLSFSIGCKLFQRVKENDTWFTKPACYVLLFFGCLFIDIVGFLQIAEATMSTNLRNRALIVAAFTVAFEVAPLYIGYAICLKCYKLSSKIHNIILILSTISFILGISGNAIYRIMTKDYAYRVLDDNGKWTVDKIALPLTILMIILPIITSMINIVIGCLSFDPLLIEIHRLSKKLHILCTKRQQLLAYIEEINKDSKIQEQLINAEKENYDNAIAELLATRTRLINYVSACSAPTNIHEFAKKKER